MVHAGLRRLAPPALSGVLLATASPSHLPPSSPQLALPLCSPVSPPMSPATRLSSPSTSPNLSHPLHPGLFVSPVSPAPRALKCPARTRLTFRLPRLNSPSPSCSPVFPFAPAHLCHPSQHGLTSVARPVAPASSVSGIQIAPASPRLTSPHPASTRRLTFHPPQLNLPPPHPPPHRPRLTGFPSYLSRYPPLVALALILPSHPSSPGLPISPVSLASSPVSGVLLVTLLTPSFHLPRSRFSHQLALIIAPASLSPTLLTRRTRLTRLTSPRHRPHPSAAPVSPVPTRLTRVLPRHTPSQVSCSRWCSSRPRRPPLRDTREPKRRWHKATAAAGCSR